MIEENIAKPASEEKSTLRTVLEILLYSIILMALAFFSFSVFLIYCHDLYIHGFFSSHVLQDLVYLIAGCYALLLFDLGRLYKILGIKDKEYLSINSNKISQDFFDSDTYNTHKLDSEINASTNKIDLKEIIILSSFTLLLILSMYFTKASWYTFILCFMYLIYNLLYLFSINWNNYSGYERFYWLMYYLIIFFFMVVFFLYLLKFYEYALYLIVVTFFIIPILHIIHSFWILLYKKSNILSIILRYLFLSFMVILLTCFALIFSTSYAPKGNISYNSYDYIYFSACNYYNSCYDINIHLDNDNTSKFVVLVQTIFSVILHVIIIAWIFSKPEK